jgi:hypothetical protein
MTNERRVGQAIGIKSSGSKEANHPHEGFRGNDDIHESI